MSRRKSNDRGSGSVPCHSGTCQSAIVHDRPFPSSSTDVGHHQLDNLEEEDEDEDVVGGQDRSQFLVNSHRPSPKTFSQVWREKCDDRSIGATGGGASSSGSSSGLGGASRGGIRKTSRGNGQFPSYYYSGRAHYENNDEDSGSESGRMLPMTSASSSSFDHRHNNAPSSSSSYKPHNNNYSHHQNGHVLEEEFSVDLPSDLPSGYVDIEGNMLGNLRLGEEEDDDDEEDEDELMMMREDEMSGEFVGRKGEGGAASGGYLSSEERIRRERERKLSVISNGRVFTHGRGYHLHNHCHRHHQGVGRDNSTSAQSNSSTSTITQHYYPEGGWGYIVLVTAVLSHVLMCGVNLCAGLIIWAIMGKFGSDVRSEAGWLGACSVGVSLFLSPVWVSICKRKSTRLTAVFGGLVASLGCLFTSFATQLHQVFFSYATILGVGVGLTRDASSLMVGQYFKRKRDLVEIIVVAASGLGILVMSILINNAINSFGWRLGLQAITGTLFFCFFLGTCYRSASLYHPQRRAILHLKNQKRKVKEKEKRHDKPPFLDCSCLRSKTVQILLLSSACTSFGIYSPIFYVAIDYNERNDIVDLSLSLMYIYIGGAWIVGCLICGILIVQKSKDCRVSKQYLCQVSGILSSISVVTFTLVKGQSGLIAFCCLYGFSLGSYNYALKIYTYERVRARHFPRAWSFIQSSQALPLFLGVPFTGYLNDYFPGWRAGYYLSAASVFIGSMFLFLTNVRRRRLSRRKSQNSSVKTCETTEKSCSPKLRRLSFAFPVEQIAPESKHEPICDGMNVNEDVQDGMDASVLVKELTCISEEAIADMDFQDIYFEEWDDFFDGECITSCNKVEDCLVSEFPEKPPNSCPDSYTNNSGGSSGSGGMPTRMRYYGGNYYGSRKKRPGLHAGLAGTAAALARGVASVGTRLPPSIQEQDSAEENSPEKSCPEGSSHPLYTNHVSSNSSSNSADIRDESHLEDGVVKDDSVV